MMPPYIATPRQHLDSYPWRPMDNRERRSVWSQRYYLLYTPYVHDEENIEQLPIKLAKTVHFLPPDVLRLTTGIHLNNVLDIRTKKEAPQ